MILRSLTKHVKDQNWFAVGLDFIIVVVGVVIGIQVANWNEQRIQDSRANSYLQRIHADLGADIDNLRERLVFWQQVSEYGEGGLAYATTGDSANVSPWELLLSYFQASQAAEFYTTKSTYEELKSDGALGLIENLELRDQLARYYLEADNPVLTERPAYREQIRGFVPLHIQSYIWKQCFWTSSYSQKLLPCESPISPDEAMALVTTISTNEHLISALRYWMSTKRVAQLLSKERDRTAHKLRAEIEDIIGTTAVSGRE
ncbi:hypothetical protein [Congregibacter sp.]|uniref:hypothetical protein n=1 Tax=Congregibacter sp. TaxID=2744308 RepID=UPI0039E27474